MISLSSTSDHDLVSQLREGSQDAYTEIYNRYKWLLHSHAYKKLGDRDAANDLIQELFTNLWTKRKDISLTSTLSAYLYTSVYNRVINVYEHRQVETKYIDSLVEYANNYVDSTDYLIREKQFTEIIEKEIALLPPKMREIFELSRKRHATHKEIAETLNISEATVTKQIKNALKILKVRLGLVIYLFLITRF